MSPFVINPEDVTAAAGNVQETYDQIQGLLSQVNQKVLSLEGSFQGSAANAFQELYANYNRNANSLNESLAAIARALNVTATNATELQQQLTNMFSGNQ